MKNLTNSFLSLGFWSYAESFGFNTDILATNPIDLSVVLGLLIFFFFGKGKKSNLINSTYQTLEQFGIYKNETIRFEQQRASNQVLTTGFPTSLKGSLGTLTSSLNELHLCTINANIGMFGTLIEIID
ncbi:hypothetical protein RGQ29_020874 [Quercus rubra]|uniref:ATP synthase CF0 subunit I n=1 Tax=Quercus rubra TaxID=3512 RepID=A0AAN7FBV8_QUERU|nr:hypothetical protein RGQ29_020874 [Quercus rubra]